MQYDKLRGKSNNMSNSMLMVMVVMVVMEMMTMSRLDMIAFLLANGKHRQHPHIANDYSCFNDAQYYMVSSQAIHTMTRNPNLPARRCMPRPQSDTDGHARGQIISSSSA